MTELEIMQRAKMYMDMLAQGIDPISREELPGDSVLNQVRLARCFFYVSGVLQQVIDNGGTVGKKPKRSGFTLTPRLRSLFRPADHPLRISEFTEMLASEANDPNVKRPGTTIFTDWLLEKGFMEKITNGEGKTQRIPTDAGRQIGLVTEARQGQYGEYTAVYYSTQAQQFLLDHLEEIFPADETGSV